MLGPDARARRDERYDAIIDFAELEEFQDLKLKNYSSGMQVRLAFAVMVHVDADLLLIDEVLAVGDAAVPAEVLRRPAPGEARRAHDPARDARHGRRSSASATGRCCSSAASWSRSATPREVADRYLELNFARAKRRRTAAAASTAGAGDGRARRSSTRGCRTSAGTRTEVARAGPSCALCMRVRFLADTSRIRSSRCVLTDPDGDVVFAASTEWEERAAAPSPPARRVDVARDLRQLVRSRALRGPPAGHAPRHRTTASSPSRASPPRWS